MAKGITTRLETNRIPLNQYFTPPRVVKAILNEIPIKYCHSAVDPAVGAGAFLVEVLDRWPKCKVFGVDIDSKWVGYCRDKLPRGRFITADSLAELEYNAFTDEVLCEGEYGLVLGNPPFSSCYDRIRDRHILDRYHLGIGVTSQAIELLFLEKFIRVCRPGGYIGIVLPHSLVTNSRDAEIRKFITELCQVRSVLEFPRHTFQFTSAKTVALVLQKRPFKGYDRRKRIEIKIYSEGALGVNWKADCESFLRGTAVIKVDRDLSEPSLNHSLVKLEDFIEEIVSGRTLYGEQREFARSGKRFLHATNVTPYGISYQRDGRFIEPGSPMDSERATTRPGDLVFCRVGVGCAGRTSPVIDERDVGVASDYLHIIRLRNYEPTFLHLFLQTRWGKAQLELFKHGVGTVSINKTQLHSLNVPQVPLRVQSPFVQPVAKLREKLVKGASEEVLREQLSGLVSDVETLLWGNSGSEGPT